MIKKYLSTILSALIFALGAVSLTFSLRSYGPPPLARAAGVQLTEYWRVSEYGALKFKPQRAGAPTKYFAVGPSKWETYGCTGRRPCTSSFNQPGDYTEIYEATRWKIENMPTSPVGICQDIAGPYTVSWDTLSDYVNDFPPVGCTFPTDIAGFSPSGLYGWATKKSSISERSPFIIIDTGAAFPIEWEITGTLND